VGSGVCEGGDVRVGVCVTLGVGVRVIVLGRVCVDVDVGNMGRTLVNVFDGIRVGYRVAVLVLIGVTLGADVAVDVKGAEGRLVIVEAEAIVGGGVLGGKNVMVDLNGNICKDGRYW